MGITRARLSFEDDYTQIPNAWVRNKKLSRRARGLLVEIVSHRPGWHITLRSLAANGTEGRDALRSAINELRSHGYLAMVQNRGEGNTFDTVEYVLQDPANPANGKSVSGGASADGFSGDGFSADGKSDPKNTIDEEHQTEEHQEQDSTNPVTFHSAGDQGDDGESYQQAGDHLVDIPRVVGHIETNCGRQVSDQVAFAIVATVLERSKSYPRKPTAYVMAAITSNPFGWQQYIDGGKVPR